MSAPERSLPVEETCHRCDGELVPGAAYCDSCGQRTRRASRMVRFWARLELLFLLLFAVLVIGFTFVFYVQR